MAEGLEPTPAIAAHTLHHGVRFSAIPRLIPPVSEDHLQAVGRAASLLQPIRTGKVRLSFHRTPQLPSQLVPTLLQRRSALYSLQLSRSVRCVGQSASGLSCANPFVQDAQIPFCCSHRAYRAYRLAGVAQEYNGVGEFSGLASARW